MAGRESRQQNSGDLATVCESEGGKRIKSLGKALPCEDRRCYKQANDDPRQWFEKCSVIAMRSSAPHCMNTH